MKFVDGVPDFVEQDTSTPNLREVHTDFGETIRLERRNPYGFVHVVWYNGPAPDKLSGAYSDFDTAREAVLSYLKTNTFIRVVEEPVAKPVLTYKKERKNINAPSVG